MKCRPRTVAPVSTSSTVSSVSCVICSCCFQLGLLLTVIGPEATDSKINQNEVSSDENLHYNSTIFHTTTAHIFAYLDLCLVFEIKGTIVGQILLK